MTLLQTKSVQLQLDRDVLHFTFDRPEARNAMSIDVVDDLIDVFGALQDRSDIRAVVLRGKGGHFCSGGDIKDFARIHAQPAAEGVDAVAQYNRRFGRALQLADAVPQATVAVLEGAVLGGGFGLACVADVVIASASANFGLPETGLGIPPAQIAPFVVRRVGISQARRLVVCGARFDGREALRLGVVHFVEDDTGQIDERLAETLKQIRRCAPQANAATKKIMQWVGQRDLDTVLDEASTLFSSALRGPEAGEGTMAFMQKRPPNWAE